VIDGTHNALLGHDLFGAPLGGYWLGGAGPLSAHGAVFAGLFLLLAGIGWVTARRTRALAAPASVAAAPAALTKVIPFITVAFAAFMPLASGLYLATTTAWTLGERIMLRWLSDRRSGTAG
jgi:YidC/Oxa1 family membrane protein insertase